METTISDEKISVSEFRTMLFEDDDTYYYEIIDGHMIRKSAPAPLHQRISRKLLLVLDRFISGSKSGELFQSPIDVYLDEYNKPQPDIIFISKEKSGIITPDGIMGVPDLIIEIISPTSIIRDRIEKKNLYERMTVQEYWLVDPQYEAIEIYTLQNNRYELFSAATTFEGEFKSALFDGLSINTNDIFAVTA